jgi:hypothetical protein
MRVVPGATLSTLMAFLQQPELAKPSIHQLEGSTRRFFESHFFSQDFSATRAQILTRLWGILSNPVLERLFASERNKVDLFEAMNRGHLILIHTAKDLLKQEGCEILGRFFIALICQAVQERAALAEQKRKPTFVYIDETHDYFDERLGDLFTQARKYKVGLTLAHQHLDQLDTKLRAAVMTNTAIKLAGGVCAKDAARLAREMRCAPEDLQSVKKRAGWSEFLGYIRHQEQPFILGVPMGFLESQPRLTEEALEEIKAKNRIKYSKGGGLAKPPTREDVQVTTWNVSCNYLK